MQTNMGKQDIQLRELFMLTISAVVARVDKFVNIGKKWWLRRAEQHFLLCANVEEERAREAHRNVAYYQKRAALARSECNQKI